jgi:hypothetical protein
MISVHDQVDTWILDLWWMDSISQWEHTSLHGHIKVANIKDRKKNRLGFHSPL